jgi:small subunit ribosomal protein S1
MESSLGSQPPAPEGDGWWAATDEGYWQALLEQGEIASEASPVSVHETTYYSQAIESGTNTAAGSQAAAGGQAATDLLPVSDTPAADDTKDEWQVAKLSLEEGDLFDLKVSGANRGGLLVEWNGMQGFVPASHLTEMPRQRDPRDRVSELANRIGESLTVRLIEVDEIQNRLVFSERGAMPGRSSPAAILGALQNGDVCHGTVTSLTTFGAFVDLGGVEGLIHISELSWDRVRHPGDVLHPGESVEVHVLDVNAKEQRVALSLKRARPDPWTQVEPNFRVGQIIEGTVTNVVGFGAFVRVAEGLEGLVHISELAEGSFLHPRNVVREGDVVQVRVLNIDPAKHRLGLSLRQAHDLGVPVTG